MAGIYDTPNRELYPNQGRWLSPDPAQAGWNLYAYPANPNSTVDPSGLVGGGMGIGGEPTRLIPTRLTDMFGAPVVGYYGIGDVGVAATSTVPADGEGDSCCNSGAYDTPGIGGYTSDVSDLVPLPVPPPPGTRMPPPLPTAEEFFLDPAGTIFDFLSGKYIRGLAPGVREGMLPTPDLIPSFLPNSAASVLEGAEPVGSALKDDLYHTAATWMRDEAAQDGTAFALQGADGSTSTLIQIQGGLNDVAGRYEYIVNSSGELTHQLFVPGGSINGIPIKP